MYVNKATVADKVDKVLDTNCQNLFKNYTSKKTLLSRIDI